MRTSHKQNSIDAQKPVFFQHHLRLVNKHFRLLSGLRASSFSFSTQEELGLGKSSPHERGEQAYPAGAEEQ